MSERAGGAFVFVGEKPSARAYGSGLTWTDGRLAARTLFDALRSIGVEPLDQEFLNLFGDSPDAAESDGPEVARRADMVRALGSRRTVVAMGKKVARLLGRHGVDHVCMVHPAARGRIRAKAVYMAHVRDVLRMASAQPVPAA